MPDLISLGSMTDDAALQDGEIDVVKVGPKGKMSKQLELISAAASRYLYESQDIYYAQDCVSFILKHLSKFRLLSDPSELQKILEAFLKARPTSYVKWAAQGL